MIILDASPAIVLAKIGRLQLLKQNYGRAIIGPVVKKEVVDQGEQVGASEVVYIRGAMEDGWIKQVQLTLRERKISAQALNQSGIHEGEAESLALGLCRGHDVVLDDREARAMAESLGVGYLGTAGVILESFTRQHVSFDELERTVRDLGSTMWLSPDVVTEILIKARETMK